MSNEDPLFKTILDSIKDWDIRHDDNSFASFGSPTEDDIHYIYFAVVAEVDKALNKFNTMSDNEIAEYLTSTNKHERFWAEWVYRIRQKLIKEPK